MNTKQIIGFHNPDEEYGYLSNWYRSDFEKDGIRFSSMEQYMMYQKARCFRDEKVAAEILKTDDVGRIKELGRQASNYDESIGTKYPYLDGTGYAPDPRLRRPPRKV